MKKHDGCEKCEFDYNNCCRGRNCCDCLMYDYLRNSCRCTSINCNEDCPYFVEANNE